MRNILVRIYNLSPSIVTQRLTSSFYLLGMKQNIPISKRTKAWTWINAICKIYPLDWSITYAFFIKQLEHLSKRSLLFETI